MQPAPWQALLSVALTFGRQADSNLVRPLEPADLGAWLDGVVPRAIRDGRIAGGVVVVVKDGRVLLARGYGWADVEARIPVDPATTLFRPGSISKLFTTVAIAQLVERGQLDLDRDVSRDLDFDLPPGPGGPITLRHLLTHTAGFGETLESLVFYDSTRIEPLGRYLARHLPTRVAAAGQVPAYSNYGLALAGYVVERAAGQPFESVIEERVFRPIGMLHSTFRQPLPDSLRPSMSRGYRSDIEPPVPFEIYGPRPAGGLSATGLDIGRFMIALLAPADSSRRGWLRPETVDSLFARRATGFPAINGMALGFMEYDRSGVRIVGHDGGAPAFRSNLRIFPGRGVGLFVSFNSIGAGGAVFPLREALIDGFVDRYIAAPAPPRATTVTAVEHGRAASGRYEASQRSMGFLSLLSLDQTTVDVAADGTLELSSLTDPSGRPRRWREVEPWVWEEVRGHDRLEMAAVDGRVTMIRRSGDAAGAYLPVPGWRSAGWNVPLFVGAVTILLLSLAGSLVRSIVRSHYGLERRGAPIDRLALAVVAVDLGFLLGWLALLARLALGHADDFGPALAPWIRAMQLTGLVGVVGLGVLVASAREAWHRGVGWAGRLDGVLRLAAGSSAAWFGFAFHAFTWRLRY